MCVRGNETKGVSELTSGIGALLRCPFSQHIHSTIIIKRQASILIHETYARITDNSPPLHILYII